MAKKSCTCDPELDEFVGLFVGFEVEIDVEREVEREVESEVEGEVDITEFSIKYGEDPSFPS